jgi:folate-binding protein YgfZ
VLVILPALAVEVLLTHLKMYARISGTVIETAGYKVYVDLQTGEWLLNESDLSAEVTEDEFTVYRVEHNLPWQGIDYQTDEFILNVDSGQFVSFTKGCFLGQEPVAKVHNRSKPSKKLIVKSESDCNEEEKLVLTSKVKDSKMGDVKGFVFVKNN